MASRKQRVAVYGTLRRGGSNHRLLEEYNANYLGEDVLYGWIMLGTGGFPALVPSDLPDKTARVRVEVYEVSEVGMARLDALEGVDNDFYERWDVPTCYGAAVMYVWHPMTFHTFMLRHPDLLPVIAGGDWMASRGRPIGFNTDSLVKTIDSGYMERVEEILSTGVDPADNIPEDDADIDDDDSTIVEEPEAAPEEPLPSMTEYEYPIVHAMTEEYINATVSDPAF